MTELHESIQGCGNHSCIIRKPIGQGTNGGCTCINRNMSNREIRDLKQFIYWLKGTIAYREKALSEVLAATSRVEHELRAKGQQDCTMTNVCHWKEDNDGIWNGTCGIEWSFEYATTPNENKMHYCPNCGAVLLQQTGD